MILLSVVFVLVQKAACLPSLLPEDHLDSISEFHPRSGLLEQRVFMTEQNPGSQGQAQTVHVEDIHVNEMAHSTARLEGGGETSEHSLRCDVPPPTPIHANREALVLGQEIEDLTLEDFPEPYADEQSNSRVRSRRSARHRRSIDTFDDLAGLTRHIAADREYDAWCAAHPEVFLHPEDASPAESEEGTQLAQSVAQGNIELAEEQDIGIIYKTNMAGSQQNNHFPSFESNGVRQASPTASTMNGSGANGSVNHMTPLPVGHQQDIYYLNSQIQQLARILAQNREKVSHITRTAEEVARRANGSLNDGGANKESDAARIRELELELARANRTIDLYRNEQGENTALIADYENALGNATDQIRNYCCDNNDRYLAQRRHYNGLLQAEKDEHLQSRMERDEWHAKCMQVCEMIRKAYRLRCEEWNQEQTVISGLQGEVRILRKCLGMEEERPEEETGWEYLREETRPPPMDEVPPS